jgi:hypothetical protein
LERWFRCGGTEPAGFPGMMRRASHREEASDPLQERPAPLRDPRLRLRHLCGALPAPPQV